MMLGRLLLGKLHMSEWAIGATSQNAHYGPCRNAWDPERVSGAWVFRGTRVPVSALFENLEDGAVASQFVDWFPGVTLEQVRSVLDHAARSALATA